MPVASPTYTAHRYQTQGAIAGPLEWAAARARPGLRVTKRRVTRHGVAPQPLSSGLPLTVRPDEVADDPRALYGLLPPDAHDAIYELLLTDRNGRLRLHSHQGVPLAVTFAEDGVSALCVIWMSPRFGNRDLAF